MLRVLAFLVLTTAPAFAWEATTGSVCELVHDGETARVRVTYDSAIPEYAIAITPARPWAQAPTFSIRFDGPRGLTISTNRHKIFDRGATLIVRDRGFGNVLNGLEFNKTATAILGDQAVVVPLDGAGPAVRAFRACTSAIST